MITPTLDIQRTGNIGAQESFAMRLDENSLDFLMTILSDLYSDPQAAVIREYSVNAWDSHVEAGVLLPILVNTPTGMSPYFTVQDFGVGLSVDEIRTIYSAYGASTKRGSNDQTGMLGLGSKSGLTISGQFTVTAVKGGKKAQVLVSRTETGGGSMDVVSVTDTNERNGVTISIPVGHNSYGFTQKAEEFFKFWPAGRVLVNGKEPAHYEGDEISPGILMVDNQSGYRVNDYVIMGGVSYPIDHGYRTRTVNGSQVIFTVPIGSVHFTPSREQLHYTTTTKATLNRIYKDFDTKLDAFVTNDIESSPDTSEALLRLVKWMSRFSMGYRIPQNWHYRGKPIPADLGPYEVMTPDSHFKWEEVKLSTLSVTGLDRFRYSGAGDPVPSILVTDFEHDTLSSYAKGKLRKLRNVKGNAPVYVVKDIAKVNQDPWMKDCVRMTWKEVLEAVKNVVTYQRKATPVFNADDQFHVFDPNAYAYDFQVKAVPAGKKFFYFEPKDYPKQNIYTLTSLSKELDCLFVKVYARRAERFKNVHPNAQHINELPKHVSDLFKAKLSDVDKFHATLRDHSELDSSDFRWIDPARINDPELTKLVNLSKSEPQSNRWVRSVKGYLNDLGFPAVIDEALATMDISRIEEYPLIGAISSYTLNHGTRKVLLRKHMYEYMNTIYDKIKEEDANQSS